MLDRNEKSGGSDPDDLFSIAAFFAQSLAIMSRTSPHNGIGGCEDIEEISDAVHLYRALVAIRGAKRRQILVTVHGNLATGVKHTAWVV
jgi:hypothetical protein